MFTLIRHVVNSPYTYDPCRREFVRGEEMCIFYYYYYCYYSLRIYLGLVISVKQWVMIIGVDVLIRVYHSRVVFWLWQRVFREEGNTKTTPSSIISLPRVGRIYRKLSRKETEGKEKLFICIHMLYKNTRSRRTDNLWPWQNRFVFECTLYMFWIDPRKFLLLVRPNENCFPVKLYDAS